MSGIRFIHDGPTGLELVEKDITTRKDALLALTTKSDAHFARSVLVNSCIEANLIKKKDLLFLWKNNILTLEDIYSVFEREELWEIVSATKNIKEWDLQLLFGRLLYRTEAFPFTAEKIREWFDGSVYDGKLYSLIAIALWKTDPKRITLNDIWGRVESLVYSQPESHGIHRLLFLAHRMAEDDVDKQTVAMDMFVHSCTTLYFRERFTYDFLIEYIQNNDGWYKTVRNIGLQKIKIGLQEIAQKIVHDTDTL